MCLCVREQSVCVRRVCVCVCVSSVCLCVHERSECVCVCERVWCAKVEVSRGTATTDPDTRKSASIE